MPELKNCPAKRVSSGRGRNRPLLFIGAGIVLAGIVSCTPGLRQVFLDIPPPTEQEMEQKALRKQPSAQAIQQEEEEVRPAIEGVLDWEQVQSELPEHALGGIDWTEAVRQGLVRPRTGADPDSARAGDFKMDFFLAAEKPKFDAYFPHSAHTEWLGCQNCHAALFPNKDNEMTMKEMRKGQYCGACHGPVAFDLKQCKRCHTRM